MVQYTRFSSATASATAGGQAPAEVSRQARAASHPPQRDSAARPNLRDAAGTTAKTAGLSVVALLFLWSLILPVYLNVGGIRMSPVRVMMLITFIPLFFAWISGKCGRVRAADIWIMLFAVWMFITFNLDGGASSFEYSVVTIIETVCPYLLARYYIRNRHNYEALVRLLRWFAIILLPGAIIEATTGFRIYNKVFGLILPTHGWANYDQRLGMFRAQTVFEHPILYGMFVAFFFAPAYALARNTKSWFGTMKFNAPIVAATFFSLSAGAYVALNIQLMLLAWGGMMKRVKGHWMILTILGVVGYVVVDLLSNRTPFQVLSSYLAFNSGTAYHRVLIAKFGMENVWAHPWLGLGLNDWVRPTWLHSGSVDNFWLVFAMRHGIPGFVLIFCGYMAVILGLARARPGSRAVALQRDGLAIGLCALAFAIATVHLWSATYNFLMFMLGAAAWFGSAEARQDQGEGSDAASPDAVQARRAQGQTRSGAARQ